MVKKTIVKPKSVKVTAAKEKVESATAEKSKSEKIATQKSKNRKLKSEKTSDTKVKHLCQWKKKHFKDRFDEYSTLATPVTYICTKCGRGASDKKYLCKPEKIKM